MPIPGHNPSPYRASTKKPAPNAMPKKPRDVEMPAREPSQSSPYDDVPKVPPRTVPKKSPARPPVRDIYDDI